MILIEHNFTIFIGRNVEEHYNNVIAVLKRVRDFGFKCKMSKCNFFMDEVNYLGYSISKLGKRANFERVKAITNLAVPSSVKMVESFIGKVNYYSKFIPNFSELSAPLNQLRHKNVQFKWSSQCQEAFDKLKSHLIKKPLLVHFDNNLPVILNTDASDYGIGAVILHRFPDGSEHPIA